MPQSARRLLIMLVPPTARLRLIQSEDEKIRLQEPMEPPVAYRTPLAAERIIERWQKGDA